MLIVAVIRGEDDLGQSLQAYLIFTTGGLAGQLTLDRVELIAVGIICAQVATSMVWLRHFRYGPLEWVWRSMTYGHAPPRRAPVGRG